MICSYCKIEFIAVHFNQKLCSDPCRKLSRSTVLKRHKESESFKKSNSKWIASERRKQNEFSYRQKDSYKTKAVARVARHIASSPYAKEAKRRTDHIRGRRLHGDLREWWAEESAKGCNLCSSYWRLGVDHVIPKSLDGTDDVDNLQVLCITCNSTKGAKLYAQAM